MFYVVSHKNGHVRAIVNADSEDSAYRTFREERIAKGVNPIKSNHSIDELPLLSTPDMDDNAIVFLRNTKPTPAAAA